MNTFERGILDNIEKYRELTEMYKSQQKTELEKEELLNKIYEIKNKVRNDKWNEYRITDNKKIYDRINGRQQGLIYIKNGNHLKFLMKYGLNIGHYKKSIIDITQDIPYNETIQEFLIRDFKERNKYDIWTYKHNSRMKSKGVTVNGKISGTIKDTYGNIKYDEEILKIETEKIKEKNDKLAEELIKEFGLDEESLEKRLYNPIKDLDKTINEGGNNINNKLNDVVKVIDIVGEDLNDIKEDVGKGIDIINNVVEKTSKIINKKSKIDGFSDFVNYFFKSIINIINLTIKLMNMGIKLSELIFIISPIIIIIYTFYKINMSLYDINKDYGKKERNNIEI